MFAPRWPDDTPDASKSGYYAEMQDTIQQVVDDHIDALLAGKRVRPDAAAATASDTQTDAAEGQ